jgi:hypothetical protein
VLKMPPESPWPVVLGVFVALLFTALLLSQYVLACIFGGIALAALAAWHLREPELE